MNAVNSAMSRIGSMALLLVVVFSGCGGLGGQPVPTEGEGSVYDAAFRGELSYVANYLNGGFDVNTPDEHGRTLVHHAAAGNQTYMLETLFEEFSADGTITDENGMTPLAIARDNQAEAAAWYLEEDQGLQ